MARLLRRGGSMHSHDEIGPDVGEHETHATTGGAAAAGALTGAVVGLVGGPAGAAVGALGGAIVGVAAERIMHHDDDHLDAREVSSQSPRAWPEQDR